MARRCAARRPSAQLPRRRHPGRRHRHGRPRRRLGRQRIRGPAGAVRAWQPRRLWPPSGQGAPGAAQRLRRHATTCIFSTPTATSSPTRPATQVRFLGATLWTDFRLLGDDTRQAAMRDAEAAMNDYKRIRLANMGFRKLRAADTAMFHAQQKAWLSRELAQPFDGRTVVISHMAPSLQSVDDAYGSEGVFARLRFAPGRPGRAGGPVGAWPHPRFTRLPDRPVPRGSQPLRLQDAQRHAAKSRILIRTSSSSCRPANRQV